MIRFQLLAVAFAFTSPWADAAVVVLTNHTPKEITVEVASANGSSEIRRIAPADSKPFFSTSQLTVGYGTGTGRRIERVAADSVYRFVTLRAGGHSGTQLRRIGLAGEVAAAPNAAAWQTGAGAANAPVRVLLCVDEEEPLRDSLWQARLAQRLAKASEILERHSGVRFEMIGYRTWQSNNAVDQFERTLFEFEKSIKPADGVLAIGFTSQYQVQRNQRRRMGGTRGPLRQHILLREWSPRISEPERLELLVHELGHFLGASHSPEMTSVMRPTLGDRPVRLRDETIRFDPVNTLAIAMVGEEVRRRGVHDLARISADRRRRLQRVYNTLSALTPGEPAGATLLRRLAAVREPADVVTSADRSEADAIAVVAAVTRAAAANRKEPLGSRLSGDALADHLIRTGTAAGTNAKGVLIGLGIALDDVGALRINPRTRELVARIESDRERRRRLNVIDSATAQGRGDTLKHFIVSAGLTAAVGEKEANLWGIGKELADATRRGGSGFSFADLAANRAGVRLAKGVMTGNPPISGLARGFRIRNYVPSIEGLEEGITLDDLIKRFGGQGDPRFDAEIDKIDQRIEALPAYSLMKLGL